MYPGLPINSIVSQYKDAFDWLHAATSRQIIVIISPLQSGCQNHSGYNVTTKEAGRIYNSNNPFSTGSISIISSLGISGTLNIPFTSGSTCPVCDGKGFLYSPASGTCTARIQFRNADTKFTHEDVKLKSHDFKVRIKVTGQASTDLLDRAEQVIIDGQTCRIIQEKVPVGLRDIHTYYYYLDDLQ